MKKILRILLLGATATQLLANDTTSHTFFSVRPPFYGAMPEKISLVYDRLNLRDCGIGGLLQVLPFGGQSINQSEIARYFLPFDKCRILAGEFGSEAVLEDTVDILANYFGVLTRPVAEVFAGNVLNTANLTFQSLISFNPQQTFGGLGLSYRQKVNRHDTNTSRDIWLQVAFPVMAVKNDLGYCERVLNEGGGALGVEVPEGFVGTVGDALRGCTVFGDKHFLYGKISNCPRTQWGVADVELALGFEDKGCDIFHKLIYGGVIVPTGNTPNGEFIFEPIVGNNHHWGTFIAGEFRYEWWCSQDGDMSLWMRSYGYSYYLFENCQRRSIDLVDKQWSRYIWVYQQTGTVGNILDISPGINSLTLNVKVQPRSSFNANAAAIFETCNLTLEAGYNTYYRQEEEVKLAQCFKEGPLIAGFDEADTTLFRSKSNATMRHYLASQSILNDLNPANPLEPRLVPIRQFDLDLSSAAHPCVVSHIIYVSGAYQWNEIDWPTLLGAGASYEFGADNLALHRWNVWGKLAISF